MRLAQRKEEIPTRPAEEPAGGRRVRIDRSLRGRPPEPPFAILQFRGRSESATGRSATAQARMRRHPTPKKIPGGANPASPTNSTRSNRRNSPPAPARKTPLEPEVGQIHLESSAGPVSLRRPAV